MQYADRQNAFQREAASLAIRQRVEGGHADNIAGNNGGTRTRTRTGTTTWT